MILQSRWDLAHVPQSAVFATNRSAGKGRSSPLREWLSLLPVFPAWMAERCSRCIDLSCSSGATERVDCIPHGSGRLSTERLRGADRSVSIRTTSTAEDWSARSGGYSRYSRCLCEHVGLMRPSNCLLRLVDRWVRGCRICEESASRVLEGPILATSCLLRMLKMQGVAHDGVPVIRSGKRRTQRRGLQYAPLASKPNVRRRMTRG